MLDSTENRYRLPHFLRISILLLRIALGVNFFYVGFGTLFNKSIGQELRQKLIGNLYTWVNSSVDASWVHAIAPWIFLIIGISLAIGFATRLSALAGLSLVIIDIIPTITFPHINTLQALNNEIIMIPCLLILFFGRAGTYVGADQFFHFSLRGKK